MQTDIEAVKVFNIAFILKASNVSGRASKLIKEDINNP